MRTRILKLVRGGACIAIAATGLGVIAAATSSVAGATGTTVTAKLACTADTGLKQLALPAVFKVVTTTASLHTNTTKSVTMDVKFTVTKGLVNTAIRTGHLTTLSITGAPLTWTLSGFTHTATATVIQTGTETKHLTLTTPVTATLVFKHTVTMTAVSGTATIKAGPKFTTTILVPVHCKTENHTFVLATWPATGTGKVPIATLPAVTQGPVDTIASLGYAALAMSPAGALPAGQATRLYTSGATFWTASGGHGGNVWTETGALDGLTFHGSGNNASLTGTPTAAATLAFTVTVTTTTGAHVTVHNTLAIAAPPSTPTTIQPFKLTVTPGTLTLTCATATGATKPTVGQDVTSQTLAKPCTLITLGSIKLNEKRHIVPSVGHNLIISTARGGANDSWALYAVMIPTSTLLTGNPVCNFVQGFCNKTTTTPTTFPSHIINTTITPNYLGVKSKCETNHTNPATTYYNDNPTPTATAGVTPGAVGLSIQTKLCSAATGFSGGQFFVTTLDYTLIVPPNVYAGTYYGTVLYTLSETAAHVPGNPVTPPQ